jgi:hypothetical protein
MTKRAVRISRELWTEILTTGWHAEHIECVEGLPERATLVGTFLRDDVCDGISGEEWGDLVLIFEHPDWKPVITETGFTVETPNGEQVLVISPTHRIVYREGA